MDEVFLVILIVVVSFVAGVFLGAGITKDHYGEQSDKVASISINDRAYTCTPKKEAQ